MQFIVLIEFLVPGVATTLLAIALLPKDSVPLTLEGLPSGETASVLLLLAISYPVGILTNFAAFLLQRWLLTPRLHRAILANYSKIGFDLTELAGQQLSLRVNVRLHAGTRDELRDLFNLMRTIAVSNNIERLNTIISFQEGLQRFARGMLLPLILAAVLISRQQSPNLVLVGVFGGLFVLSLLLLKYSLANEEEQVARFFLTQVMRCTETTSAELLSSQGDPASSARMAANTSAATDSNRASRGRHR